MNSENKALAFVEKHGVVLVAAKGPVPRMTEAIANEPIKGSWWAHPKSQQIFATLQKVRDSKDILVCRLVDGKVTLVHRRLWPALARAVHCFPLDRLSQVREEHTSTGQHRSVEIPFPEWVPDEIMLQSKTLSEEKALSALGPWAKMPQKKYRF